jgi:hypothetical protein
VHTETLQLERDETTSGLVVYRSPSLSSLGVPNAFTTRLGPDGQEFDVGRLDSERVRELQRTLGVTAPIADLRQVHGADIHVALGPSDPPPPADALVTTVPDLLLLVRVADCVPLLVATEDGRGVGAIHAGWRGLVAGVVPNALGALRAAHPGRALVAAVGPCLGPARFEVGPDVAAEFERVGLAEVVLPGDRGRRPHVDLREAARLQLARAGVDRVDTTELCTWDSAGARGHEFFSFRRDVTHGGEPLAGRMAAVIGVAL